MVINTETTSVARGIPQQSPPRYSNGQITLSNPNSSSQQRTNGRYLHDSWPKSDSGEEDFYKLFQQRRRFTFVKILGRGSYGVVCSAYDRVTDRNVAIKKISKLNDPIVLKRTLREIKLLRYFRNTSNVVKLLEVLPIQSNDANEIYLVEELMDADMHSIIRSKQMLTEGHLQYFMFQMLLAVDEVHRSNVLHRDLKPGNILVNINCETKICDFGLARGFPLGQASNSQLSPHVPDDIPVTEYVATRWYRAPEIMLFKKYDGAADIWSLGCIFAELLNRKVMFPGKDYHDQLPKIIAKLGPIPVSMLNRILSAKLKAYVERLGNCLPPVQQTHYMGDEHAFDYERAFSYASPLAIDLLKRMLVYEPAQRITAREALRHPYLKIYADCMRVNKSGSTNAPTDQIQSTHLFPLEQSRRTLFDFSFETSKNMPDIRQQLLHEISCCVSQHEMESNCPPSYKYFQI